VLEGCAGDPRRLRRWGVDRFADAVRRELPRWHGIRPNLWIVRAVFAALIDPHGVTSRRAGALERARSRPRRLAAHHPLAGRPEARMVAVHNETWVYRSGELPQGPRDDGSLV
jgi:hypothetical protein